MDTRSTRRAPVLAQWLRVDSVVLTLTRARGTFSLASPAAPDIQLLRILVPRPSDIAALAATRFALVSPERCALAFLGAKHFHVCDRFDWPTQVRRQACILFRRYGLSVAEDKRLWPNISADTKVNPVTQFCRADIGYD